MLLEINGWVFEVDLAQTMRITSEEAEDHCTCGYCRNFYQGIDGIYPNFRSFLGQFGVNIEAPEMLLPLEPTVYYSAYRVWGRILKSGNRPMAVDGISVIAEAEGDTFLLSTGKIALPWALDEPMEEVVSPANNPDFLEEALNYFFLIDSEPQSYS